MNQVSGPGYYEGQELLRNGEHGRLEDEARAAKRKVYDLRKTCLHPETHLSIRDMTYYPNFFPERSREFHCYMCDQEWKFLYEDSVQRLARKYHNQPFPAGHIVICPPKP